MQRSVDGAALFLVILSPVSYNQVSHLFLARSLWNYGADNIALCSMVEKMKTIRQQMIL